MPIPAWAAREVGPNGSQRPCPGCRAIHVGTKTKLVCTHIICNRSSCGRQRTIFHDPLPIEGYSSVQALADSYRLRAAPALYGKRLDLPHCCRVHQGSTDMPVTFLDAVTGHFRTIFVHGGLFLSAGRLIPTQGCNTVWDAYGPATCCRNREQLTTITHAIIRQIDWILCILEHWCLVQFLMDAPVTWAFGVLFNTAA